VGMSPQIFFKDKLDARVLPQPERAIASKAKPEPEHRGAVFEKGFIVTSDPRGGPPAGSVDLGAFAYDTPEAWGQAVRIQDCVATVERSADRIVELIASVLGERMREHRIAHEKKLVALDTRLAAAEEENATLRASLAGLEKQHTKLASAHATLLELAKRDPPAPLHIKGWRVDPENATAVPQMTDGSNGAALPLLALFSGLAARFAAEVDRPSKRGRAPRANGAEAERSP
jgi:hypothetical protein